MISPWWHGQPDRRSLWLNFEITLLIDNPVFVAEMNQLVQGCYAGGDPMSLTRWRARPGTKLLENIFYLFSPCCDSQSVGPKPLSGLC